MSGSIGSAEPVPRGGWFDWFDAMADRLSDSCNPVVVRETRQEFQGTRFAVTLMLSLAAAWMCSIAGVVSMYESTGQREFGMEFFGFFYAVLAFPLCIMVPVGLFRSMTTELTGKTWELLVVTPMKASKIVRGKMGTALLQAAIYLALLAPFLCFTWLLKGIGVIHILVGLLVLVVACVTLCHLALFCGSLVRKAAWQGFAMIILIAGSLFVWGLVVGVVPNVERINMETWLGGGICFGIAILYLAVIASATAAASLTPTYPAYNQSARTMVAQSQQSSSATGEERGSGDPDAQGGEK